VALVALGGRRDADESRKEVRRPVEYDDSWDEDVVEELHRRGDEQCDPLGVRDGERLRGQLTEDDVQERDDAEPDRDGNQMKRASGKHRSQYGLEQRGDGRFADPPQSQ